MASSDGDVSSAMASDGNTSELVSLLYHELRRLAACQLAREQPGQTLQPTALVHEAYLRLERAGCHWESNSHFMVTAAEVMRRILVENARRKHALKRGGSARRLELAQLDADATGPLGVDELLALSEALDLLDQHDPQAASLSGEVSTMRQWNAQANAIFARAIEIPSNEGRRSFIERACRGDGALRAEVDRLLSAHETAGRFLEGTIADVSREVFGADRISTSFDDVRFTPGNSAFGADSPSVSAVPDRRWSALLLSVCWEHVDLGFTAESVGRTVDHIPNHYP